MVAPWPKSAGRLSRAKPRRSERNPTVQARHTRPQVFPTNKTSNACRSHLRSFARPTGEFHTCFRHLPPKIELQPPASRLAPRLPNGSHGCPQLPTAGAEAPAGPAADGGLQHPRGPAEIRGERAQGTTGELQEWPALGLGVDHSLLAWLLIFALEELTCSSKGLFMSQWDLLMFTWGVKPFGASQSTAEVSCGMEVTSWEAAAQSLSFTINVQRRIVEPQVGSRGETASLASTPVIDIDHQAIERKGCFLAPCKGFAHSWLGD